MKIRFQADADRNEDVVSGVIRREPSIDFQTAGEIELSGLDDTSVLAVAAKEGRVLVTHDRRTMPEGRSTSKRQRSTRSASSTVRSLCWNYPT